MAEGILKKVAHDLYRCVDDGLASVKVGESIRGKSARQRNLLFHNKWFALARLGFDAWEPEIDPADQDKYGGMGDQVQKNFERFRKDLIIATGHYDLVTNLKGDVRAEAKSIAFGNMDPDEFEELYSQTINVLLQKILSHYTREDIDRVVSEVLNFA